MFLLRSMGDGILEGKQAYRTGFTVANVNDARINIKYWLDGA